MTINNNEDEIEKNIPLEFKRGYREAVDNLVSLLTPTTINSTAEQRKNIAEESSSNLTLEYLKGYREAVDGLVAQLLTPTTSPTADTGIEKTENYRDMELLENENKALEELSQKIKESKRETLRKAITLMKITSKAQDEGYKLGFIKDEQIIEVKFLGI